MCAHSYAVDNESGLTSFFEVLEKIEASPIPPVPQDKVVLVRWQPLAIVAVWLIEEDKGDAYDDEYESELRLLMPLDKEPVPIGAATFQFGKPERKPFRRLTARMEAPLPLEGSGLLRVESRIRKKGAKKWKSQEFPVLVEFHRPPPVDGQPH
jgi:hypothetical protein